MDKDLTEEIESYRANNTESEYVLADEVIERLLGNAESVQWLIVHYEKVLEGRKFLRECDRSLGFNNENDSTGETHS